MGMSYGHSSQRFVYGKEYSDVFETILNFFFLSQHIEGLSCINRFFCLCCVYVNTIHRYSLIAQPSTSLAKNQIKISFGPSVCIWAAFDFFPHHFQLISIIERSKNQILLWLCALKIKPQMIYINTNVRIDEYWIRMNNTKGVTHSSRELSVFKVWVFHLVSCLCVFGAGWVLELIIRYRRQWLFLIFILYPFGNWWV